MNREDVLKTIYTVFHEVAAVPLEDMEEEASLLNLDLDSVDFMKIMLGVEDTFGFEFDNEDLDLETYGSFGRFADVVIERYLDKSSAGNSGQQGWCDERGESSGVPYADKDLETDDPDV